ncbi:hypothetical protein SNE40_011525 [Patella caerulea]|uniref:HAT C-terminal dimerisation domain-containing protein n=1 Tax=Patella caerulea TaxID=87958 RepID=A0AAN8JQ34_PATCE
MLVMYDVLNETRMVSNTLQDLKIDYLKAADLIEVFIQELKSFNDCGRQESYFDRSYGMSSENKLFCVKRKQNPSSRLDDFVVHSTLGHRTILENPVDFQKSILNPIVDTIVEELERRLSTPNLAIFRSLSSLDPNSEKFPDFKNESALVESYDLNMEDLDLEFRHANSLKLETMKDLHDCLIPLRMGVVELRKLLQIALTLPVSGVERTFSLLKKKHLRSSMTDKRHRNLAVISVHRERAMKLGLDNVVDRFAKIYPNSRIVLV